MAEAALDLVERMGVIMNELAGLFSQNYRCRFHNDAIKAMPIKDGEAFVKDGHCFCCIYSNKDNDKFCIASTKLCNTMIKLPERLKSEYECTCPDECVAGI